MTTSYDSISGTACVAETDVPLVSTNAVLQQVEVDKYVKKTALLFEDSTQLINGVNSQGPPTTQISKKPSYLGLACTVSGYSGINTYDSKLREGFRSRDQSPGRLTLTHNRSLSPLHSYNTLGTDVSKPPCCNFLVPPGFNAYPLNRTSPTNIHRNKVKDENYSLCDNLKSPELSQGNLTANLVANGEISSSTMESDKHRLRNVNESSPPSANSKNTFQATSHSSLFKSDLTGEEHSKQETSISEVYNIQSSSVNYSPIHRFEESVNHKVKQQHSPGVVRVVEFTSQTKSFVKTVTSSVSHSSNLDDNSFSHESVVQQSVTSATIGASGTPEGSTEKSFIQQRIERLYGPGALAQGFFSRTKQSPKSSPVNECTRADAVTASPPSLPVLRHLRPEFRAQLPVGSTGRKSQGPCKHLLVSFEGLQLQDKPEQEGESVLAENGHGSFKNDPSDSNLAAPEVVLPNGQACEHTAEFPESQSLSYSKEEEDGHYYLKLLKQEIDRLTGLVNVAENELNEDLSEEALGKLRTAAGQARLLMCQKLQQFEGLCHKNIVQSPDEAFPTTSEDLAGFWDMVKLQINHVDSLFEELDRLRAANWVEAKESPSRKKRSIKKVNVNTTENKTKLMSDARKVREEARKRLLEEKRRALKENKATEDIEIFVPKENAK